MKNYLTQKQAREKKEQDILDKQYDCLYNTSKTASGGDLISYHPNKEQIINKMKMSLKIRFENMTPEERKRIYGKRGAKNGMYGKTHSKETREYLSKINKGHKRSLGKKLSDEQKRKLSEFAKTRTGEKNSFYGKKHTQETKEKIRQHHIGRKPVNCKKISIDGEDFPSLSEAARTLNVSNGTIVYRLKSPNYNYNYL